jgi:uncharacterized protein YndB with AHSA1/START domain
MNRPEFVYVIYIEAPIARVWRALTNGDDTNKFWARYVQSDWKVGSRVEFLRPDRSKLSHDGDILEIDPPRRLVMTFDLRPEGASEPPSKVSYDLVEVDGAVKLTVSHEDFPPNSAVLGGISQGWPQILSSLKSYLERGEPLALTAIGRQRRGE